MSNKTLAIWNLFFGIGNILYAFVLGGPFMLHYTIGILNLVLVIVICAQLVTKNQEGEDVK